MDVNQLFQQRYGFVPPEITNGSIVKSLVDGGSERLDLSGIQDTAGKIRTAFTGPTTDDNRKTGLPETDTTTSGTTT